MKLQIQLLIIAFLLTQIAQSQTQHKKREMRAVWIATVENIDWPSKRHSAREQQEEMRKMLDDLEKNNINTIVFQARPTADALYLSTLEPWSKYLTGVQGKQPEPYYDPLQFIIEEAHKRFMEVHVWLNPYRVLNGGGLNSLSKNHIYHTQKNIIVEYGGKYYFDPGLDETRQFLNNVVKDIVERYDIDAIHMDDYFYPYPVRGKEFPDQESFKKYPRSYTNKADWRRNNVDMVIAELQQTIKSTKPWVDFGISPFGVWRNDNVDPTGSATRAGIQNYDDLYADILKWLREGTIDYVVPQLYWEIGKKVADYEVLLKWWSKNSYNKNLYIGLFASALEIKKEPEWKKPNEIARQMRINQSYPEVEGVMFFSAKPFLKNLQGLNDSIQTNFYKYKALCPENKNVMGMLAVQPENIRILKDHKDAILMWDEVCEEAGSSIAYYIVYAFKGKRVGDLSDPANILTLTTNNFVDLMEIKPDLKGYHTFVVTSLNRYKKESIPAYGVTRKL
ncbi:MAG: family 10 glycosylhydrolase [Paludibacter sp.]|nr:family 10 glycosylhydrolase [Paludibacter sp.]